MVSEFSSGSLFSVFLFFVASLALTPSSLSPIRGLQTTAFSPVSLSTVGTRAYWLFDVYTLDVALLGTRALISLLFVTRHPS